MDSDNTSHPTLRDLACEIGQVQIYWCFLENVMRAQLSAAGLRDESAKGPTISHWRTYMRKLSTNSNHGPIKACLDAVEKLAKTRNLLAHSIKSASADPSKKDSAFVICVDSYGSKRKLTIEMIRELSSEIDYVRRSTRDVLVSPVNGISHP